MVKEFTFILKGNNGSLYPPKILLYYNVDLLYARHHASEGYKINKPIEELMNSGRKSDVSIVIKMLLNECHIEF